MSNVVILTDETFEEEVLKADLPVLVDFWAPWCGPCQMMAPVLDELSVELSGKVKIAKLDVQNAAHQALAAKYEIQSIPSLKLFRNGEVIQEFLGYHEKSDLSQKIETAL